MEFISIGYSVQINILLARKVGNSFAKGARVILTRRIKQSPSFPIIVSRPFHQAEADRNLASSPDEIIDDIKSKKLTCTSDTRPAINDEEIKYYEKHASPGQRMYNISILVHVRRSISLDKWTIRIRGCCLRFTSARRPSHRAIKQISERKSPGFILLRRCTSPFYGKA